MASLFDLLSAGQLPTGDAQSAPLPDMLTKLLAMLKPDAAQASPIAGTAVSAPSFGSLAPMADQDMPTAPPSAAAPKQLSSPANPAPQPGQPPQEAAPMSSIGQPYTPGSQQAPASVPFQPGTPTPGDIERNQLANQGPPNQGPPQVATRPTQPAPQASQITTGSLTPPDNGPTLSGQVFSFLKGLSNQGGLASLDAYNKGKESENLTEQALIRRGMSPEDAHVAVQNPEILRQILPVAFGQKAQPTWGEIGVDRYGQKQYGWIDARNQRITPGNVMPGGAPVGVPGNDMPTGEDYLKTVPPARASLLRQIASGRAQYPTGMMLKTPYGQQLQQDLSQFDPTLDAVTWHGRQKTNDEFRAGGPNSPAGMITAGNTAIQHLAKLSDAATHLDNSSGIPIGSTLYNMGANYMAKGTGNVRAQSLQEFDTAKQRFAEEATKFYRGSGGSEADIKQNLDLLDAAKSPQELQAAINTNVDLINSKINALQERWTTAMGPLAGEFQIVHPETQKALDRISDNYQDTPGTVPEPGTEDDGSYTPPQGNAAPQPAAGGGLPTLSPQDAAKLKPGTPFIGLDGKRRIRQ